MCGLFGVGVIWSIQMLATSHVAITLLSFMQNPFTLQIAQTLWKRLMDIQNISKSAIGNQMCICLQMASEVEVLYSWTFKKYKRDLGCAKWM